MYDPGLHTVKPRECVLDAEATDMGPPIRRELPTIEDDLVWVECDDGSRTLKNLGLNESYHSGCGAISESLCVYVANSGIATKLACGISSNVEVLNSASSQPSPIRIIEFGFGTGTSFILTAALAELLGTPLAYCGLENRILPAAIVGELGVAETLEPNVLASHNDLEAALQLLANACDAQPSRNGQKFELANYREQTRIVEQTLHETWLALEADVARGQLLSQAQITPLVELHLWLGDATEFDSTEYANMVSSGGPLCDAIYFDAFAPEVSPDLWTRAVFQNAYELLAAQGTLTSYCVKGGIRRELEAVGFVPQRVPGPPGGKREVLVATKP